MSLKCKKETEPQIGSLKQGYYMGFVYEISLLETTTFRRLIFAEINFHKNNFCVDLFSRILKLELFSVD